MKELLLTSINPGKMLLGLILAGNFSVGCRQVEDGSRQNAVINPEIPFHVTDLPDDRRESVGVLSSDSRIGVGFFIDEERIVTNYHMTDGCSYSQCNLFFNGQYHTELLSRRFYPDLAILRVHDLPVGVLREPLKLAEQVIPGEHIGIVQNLSSDPKVASFSIDAGQVTELRSGLYWNELGYVVNTKSGSSGSPILDDHHRVVGVHKVFDSDWHLNVGTGVESLRTLLVEDREAEFDRLLQLWEQGGDSRIKFDLAEILLELDSRPDLFRILSLKVCHNFSYKSILFYLKNIRKIDISC